MTDASIQLHLQAIYRLRSEFPTEIGEIINHLVAIVGIQEHRISALEQEMEEVRK